MKNCNKCRNNKKNICKICNDYDCFEERIITSNAERIRQMDDYELTKFLQSVKCLTFSGECGYPSCTSMEGKICSNIENRIDEDLLIWLKTNCVM